jgi:urease accessory protein
MHLRTLPAGLTLLLLPGLALAHPGHVESGLIAGLAHPLGGIDHLLAMLAVGLWAAQQSGAARWALPLTFLGSMLLGALLAYGGAYLPLTESAIAGSVMAFSLLVLIAARLPMLAALGLTAAFALFHGVAHGQELPASSVALGFAGGFLLATAGLHALGFALIRYLPHSAEPLLRISAAFSAAAGGWLLVS